MHALSLKTLMTCDTFQVTQIKKLAIIVMTETRVTKSVSLKSDLTMNNFSFEFTPTKSPVGGTLLYIATSYHINLVPT